MTTDEIADSSEGGSTGDLAVVGEQQGREVSIQLLQDVYNEVTGKKETLSEGYDLALRVRMEDLQQLHFQIRQLCEQYNIQSENESVTVFHEEDSREVFSSFDRFKISDSSSLRPVESVLLKYNFLVILPKTRRPQSYSLSIRLASRVTIIHKMRQELPVAILQIMGMRTTMVTVEYVDYVVARNLLDGVDRWLKGLPTHELPKWFASIRRRSEYVRYTIKYALGAFGAYLVLQLIPNFIPSTSPDFQILLTFALLGSLSIFILFRLGRFLGSQIELALDESMAVAYIQLNRGDEKRIVQAQRQLWRNMGRGLAGAGGSVALGVISTYIARRLAA